MVKEPSLWLLVLDKGCAMRKLREVDVVDEFGAPGPLVVAWLLRAREVWVPDGCAALAVSEQERGIGRLKDSLVQLCLLFFNHPVSKGFDHLIRYVKPVLLVAEALVGALDERYIEHVVGPRQAREFNRLLTLRPDHFGPRVSAIVSRLSVKEFGTQRGSQGAVGVGRSEKRGRSNPNRIPDEQWAKMTNQEKKTAIDSRKKK